MAHARECDALLAFSTSGGSRTSLRLSPRRAGAGTSRSHSSATTAAAHIGGPGRPRDLVRWEHIPRIQEAQASAWHVLRELMET